MNLEQNRPNKATVMNLEQVLDSARAHYLKQFRSVLRERRMVPSTTVIVEPACKHDGEATREGTLNLPLRVDVVVRSDVRDDETLEVTTEDVREFEPLEFAWNDALEVSLHPFHWEACLILLHGAP